MILERFEIGDISDRVTIVVTAEAPEGAEPDEGDDAETE